MRKLNTKLELTNRFGVLNNTFKRFRLSYICTYVCTYIFMSSAGFQSQKNARREKIEVNGLTGADKLRISQLPWQQGQKNTVDMLGHFALSVTKARIKPIDLSDFLVCTAFSFSNCFYYSL